MNRRKECKCVSVETYDVVVTIARGLSKRAAKAFAKQAGKALKRRAVAQECGKGTH
jgi:hypothetical protein